MCLIHSVADFCCAVDDVESSSVAVGTTTIPVFQPQTILQVFVEEYYDDSYCRI